MKIRQGIIMRCHAFNVYKHIGLACMTKYNVFKMNLIEQRRNTFSHCQASARYDEIGMDFDESIRTFNEYNRSRFEIN